MRQDLAASKQPINATAELARLAKLAEDRFGQSKDFREQQGWLGLAHKIYKDLASFGAKQDALEASAEQSDSPTTQPIKINFYGLEPNSPAKRPTRRKRPTVSAKG